MTLVKELWDGSHGGVALNGLWPWDEITPAILKNIMSKKTVIRAITEISAAKRWN